MGYLCWGEVEPSVVGKGLHRDDIWAETEMTRKRQAHKDFMGHQTTSIDKKAVGQTDNKALQSSARLLKWRKAEVMYSNTYRQVDSSTKAMDTSIPGRVLVTPQVI